METSIKYHQLNSVTLIYATRDGITTFTAVPTSMVDKVKKHRLIKDDWCQYFMVDPMVQVALKGDEVLRDFSAGNTLYNADTAVALRMQKQEVVDDGEAIEVRTTLRSDKVEVIHVVRQVKGYEAFEMFNILRNITGKDIALDRFNGFQISALSPFMEENDSDKLILTELICHWAMEGRKCSNPISKYDFDDPWSGLGIKLHTIGSIGTMTSNGHHPFIALEDKENNATWAVQLETPSSWEIEAVHKYGGVSLTGGQADYLYGHWRKTIKPGETFTTRKAYVGVVEGDLTKACAKLTKYHDNLLHVPASEEELPIVFNEYLTTWGKPTIGNIPGQLPLIKKLDCSYYVVDAGWFCDKDQDLLGDWEVATTKFPNGLREYANLIHENGLSTAGVWYEFEGVTPNSVISKHDEMLAKRDGRVINRCNRMFFDFTKPGVNEYLTDKVINQLKNSGVTYIKIDYNENIGLGIDNPDSLGEGLRAHAEKVQEFMRKLTKEVPNLVLENCSSGGMRHEVSFNCMGSMVSFSDAHETPIGAVIAMDLQRIMQPRIMQIWASLLPTHSADDTYTILAKAMLGRICFAGKLEEINKTNFAIAVEGKDFYKKIRHIVKSGETILIDTDQITSLDHPHGSIRLVRMGEDGKEMLVYAFNFGDDVKGCSFDIPEGFELADKYGNASIEGGNVTFKGNRSAIVALFRK